MSIATFEYIDTQAAWDACLARLQREPIVAVDLEADSLYAYREKVCLIQLSIPSGDFIVDPLSDVDLSGFGELLADERIEKIFHACEYDLMLLKRDYNWELKNLFDTMWAARILGFKNMGLAWFLQELYDVKLTKKFQKANWGMRPLPTELLVYAQADTHYLLDLRLELIARLEEADRMVEAREIFIDQCNVRLPDQSFDPDGFWSIRGAKTLKPEQQAVLKALYLFRDEESSRRNLPPFKVFNNEALVGIALENPKTKDDLTAVRGIGARNTDRYGDRLLAIVRKAQNDPAPLRPKRKKRSDPRATERFERLSQWRRDRALARGVESDVILSRETLWDIARGNPNSLDDLAEIPGIGPCRLDLHGESILGELD